MLDFDIAIELMKKYGFSSTSAHPYIYQNGDTIGICYTYNDEEYGQLERIKLFDNAESFEEFLKQLQWVKNNGLNYHVKMSLDNYEIMNPKVLFLRNGKVMVEGEMFDIENFDYRESQRLQMDDVSQLIYEAGDLLLCYDEMKARQLQYLQNIVSLKNTLRSKYFELQKEVDIYNKYKGERNLTLLPEVNDIGINSSMEISIKDRYNVYIIQRPSYEEALNFLEDVWELNKQLELNTKYYDALKEENDTRNELKVVEQKIKMMKDLNENVKPLFGVDLVSKFKMINKTWSDLSTSVSAENIQQIMSRIEVKYSFFNSLNVLYLSDYLKESSQNTNYEDLAEKYSKNSNPDEVNKNRMMANEIAASLSIQYRDKLTPNEQAILILYNNPKMRELCNAILEIDDFENTPIKIIISKINSIVGFSKIKTECYDLVKKRLEDPINQNIKNMLFSNFDFTSFESYLSSLVANLTILKKVDYKMFLNGDLDMYLKVHNIEEIGNKKFALVTNDLATLLNETKNSKDIIAITLLKESTPVLYAPYYFDIGDVYNKDASNQMYIKEMVNFEILVEMSDIVFIVNPIKVPVARYYSEISTMDNYSLVSEIKMAYKTDFCRYTFYSALGDNKPKLVQNVVLKTKEENTTTQVPEANIQSAPVSVIQQSVDISNNVSEAPVTEKVVNSNETNEVKETVTAPIDVSRSTDNVKVEAENVEQKDNGSVVAIEKSPKVDETEPNKEQLVASVNEDSTKSVTPTSGPKVETEHKEMKLEEKEHPQVLGKPQIQPVKKFVNGKPVLSQPKPVSKPGPGGHIQPKSPVAPNIQKTINVKPIVKTGEGPKPIAGTPKPPVGAPRPVGKPTQPPVAPSKPVVSGQKTVVKNPESNSGLKAPNIIKSNGVGTKIVTTKTVARPVSGQGVSKPIPRGVTKPIVGQGLKKPIPNQEVVKVVTNTGEVKMVPKPLGVIAKPKISGQPQPKLVVKPILEQKTTEDIKSIEEHKE